jgi:hypothetical protein
MIAMSEALLKRLSEALAAVAGRQEALSLILYSPFGIVRGEITGKSVEAATQAPGEASGYLELRQAVVEHYSNHLPTGNYARLFINLRDVSGFVIESET